MSQFAPEDRQGSIDFVSDRDITFEADRDQDGAGDIVFKTGGVERARLNHDGTGTGPFGGSVPLSVTQFGAKCDWDGTTGTDDTTAIQNALDTAATEKCDILIPGWSKITDTISRPSGVRILGYGAGWKGGASDPAWSPASMLAWGGAAGGVMVEQVGVQGGGILGLALDGQDAVAKGFYLQAAQGGLYQDIATRNMGSRGSGTFTSGVALWAEGSTVANTMGNLFALLNLEAAQPIRLTAVSASTSASDACINTFMRLNLLFGSTSNEDGIFLDCCDDNQFVGVYLFRNFGTGYGIKFGTRARNNYMFHPYPSPGGVYCDTPLTAGWTNVIFGLQRNDSAPAPVFNTGAKLTWTEGGTAEATGWYLSRPVRPAFSTYTQVGTTQVAVDSATGEVHQVSLTDSSSFVLNVKSTTSPALLGSQQLIIEVTNNSGGVAGTITLGGAIEPTGAATLTAPASTKKRNIRLFWNGSFWIETGRASADYT